LLAGGLALYVAFDVSMVAREWFWTLALTVNAAGLVVAAGWRHSRARGRG